ncbi:MAG: hypothetical protein R3F35_15370 [Myxococcota bacterium]
MRSPSRLALTTLLSALFVATATGAAFAGESAALELDPIVSFESADFGGAQAQQVAARVDERLAISLAGPTWMECRNDVEAGFETCVVRAVGTPTSKAPAAMAQN